jgi:hypothetical protein
MPNTRVFYASHAVSVDGTTVNGAQSVALNTNFNIENLFQLGRLAAYDSVPQDPEVEITINKALDGHELVWTLMGGGAGLERKLLDVIKEKRTVLLTVGDDNDEFIGEGGIAHNANPSIRMTGCYLSSFNYTFSVDGPFTEEVTLLGSSKEVVADAVAAPQADPLGGNVLARQNFKTGAATQLPTPVSGKRLSQITISGDLGSESVFELGNFYPVLKQAQLPTDITITFDVIADNHDGFEVDPQTVEQCASPEDVIGKETIVIELCDGEGNTAYLFDFRDSEDNPTAKLNSISYSGGDTGGGNVTITYTYIVANTLAITE